MDLSYKIIIYYASYWFIYLSNNCEKAIRSFVSFVTIMIRFNVTFTNHYPTTIMNHDIFRALLMYRDLTNIYSDIMCYISLSIQLIVYPL